MLLQIALFHFFFLHELYSIVLIHIHIFLIHSPVNGPLVCFCVSAIVNSAAINTGAHVSF